MRHTARVPLISPRARSPSRDVFCGLGPGCSSFVCSGQTDAIAAVAGSPDLLGLILRHLRRHYATRLPAASCSPIRIPFGALSDCRPRPVRRTGGSVEKNAPPSPIYRRYTPHAAAVVVATAVPCLHRVRRYSVRYSGSDAPRVLRRVSCAPCRPFGVRA